MSSQFPLSQTKNIRSSNNYYVDAKQTSRLVDGQHFFLQVRLSNLIRAILFHFFLKHLLTTGYVHSKICQMLRKTLNAFS